MFSTFKKIAVFTFTLSLASSSAQDDLWESKGPHVRIQRNNHDGSYIEFKRDPEDRKLVKTTKDPNGVVKMIATYFRNDRGFLTAGRIHDGRGVAIYRVRYGYSGETGQLIAEEMFEAGVKRLYPGTDQEMPVRRIYYFYDAQGNQSKAISLVPHEGKMAKEVYKKEDYNRPDLNPFDEEKRQAEGR